MNLLKNTENTARTSSYIIENSNCDLKSLYCTHLWSNSNLRKTIINAPIGDNKVTNHCSTCREKIRNYRINSFNDTFFPTTCSTPRENNTSKKDVRKFDDIENISCYDDGSIIANKNRCIPTISQGIDGELEHKFRCTSYNSSSNKSRGKLRKGLKEIGCVVDFTLNERSFKKKTQIQVCSISIMIVAIVIISLVLVNFTRGNVTEATDISTNEVPMINLQFNETTSDIASIYSELPLTTNIYITEIITTSKPYITTEKNVSYISNIITKIRKNIKTYPKEGKKTQVIFKSDSESNTEGLPKEFCDCQANEVCMLEETTGTSVCKVATDLDDPTGCGGLCALETEACHLVDKARNVRVCRLLTSATCSPREWRCKNGFCVSADARCDGSIQCYDRSDEMQCDCDLTKQFRCGQAISCFPNTKLCDGTIDCWDGLDETNCTSECPEDQFTCTNGECIVSSRFCDGFADCGDGSDEPNGCEVACNAHELRCLNKRCIPLLSRCDGHDDCGDNSDELQCH